MYTASLVGIFWEQLDLKSYRQRLQFGEGECRWSDFVSNQRCNSITCCVEVLLFCSIKNDNIKYKTLKMECFCCIGCFAEKYESDTVHRNFWKSTTQSVIRWGKICLHEKKCRYAVFVLFQSCVWSGMRLPSSLSLGHRLRGCLTNASPNKVWKSLLLVGKQF